MAHADAAQRRPAVLGDLLPGSLARDAALVAGSAALVGAAAQLAVPLPGTPVPVTGQTFAVLLAGAALGPGRAALGMLLYLLAGMAGVPWFTDGTSGTGSPHPRLRHRLPRRRHPGRTVRAARRRPHPPAHRRHDAHRNPRHVRHRRPLPDGRPEHRPRPGPRPRRHPVPGRRRPEGPTGRRPAARRMEDHRRRPPLTPPGPGPSRSPARAWELDGRAHAPAKTATTPHRTGAHPTGVAHTSPRTATPPV
ncbi:biotin transporter BioY [Actinomadura madurae]|uniref:biotin transporter BioY n=1 Tax=Actinomadura madurae TaxID=1993 RepID=UPI003FD892E5